jgi:hypothetical protein
MRTQALATNAKSGLWKKPDNGPPPIDLEDGLAVVAPDGRTGDPIVIRNMYESVASRLCGAIF